MPLPSSGFLVKGFTLIELLVAITIMTVLLGMAVARYRQFNRSQIVKEAAKTLKSDLVMAQSKAMTGQKPAAGCEFLNGYRVSFPNNSSYLLEAECLNSGTPDYVRVYVNLSTPYDAPISLPGEVRFNPVPSPILFKVLGHGTDLASSVTITVSGYNGFATAQVLITQEGEIK